MRLFHTATICILSLSAVTAEDAAKKDVMSVQYRSVGQYPTHGVTMAGALNALGIAYDKIDYLKLVGDENSVTSGLSRKVKIDESFWSLYFETAEPYKFWFPSGYRRLEIYVKGNPKAKTTIHINESDSCSAVGDPRKLSYMCRGLHRWFMAELDAETKKAEQGVEPDAGRAGK